jgi:hypothetical protein
MQLAQFRAKRGATFISANDLDQNFARVTPLQPQGDDSRIYRVNETNRGWYLVFLDKIPPRPASGTFVLGSVNGGYSWIATTGC